MAEVAASIIAIIQISQTVIASCRHYLDGIKDAPSDLRVMLIEVSTVKAIAESLQFLTETDGADSVLIGQLKANTGPIKGCRKALEELEGLFPTLSPSNGEEKQGKFWLAKESLAWPFKEPKARKLLQELMQHKTTINLALTADLRQDIKEVKQKVDRLYKSISDTQRHELLSWLVPINPSRRHSEFLELYEPGTGSWLFKTPEYVAWIEGRSRCLWIHGIPGAGKSMLASHVVEVVQEHCDGTRGNVVQLGHAYYYCHFNHKQDEGAAFLCWLISQLCRQSSCIPEELWTQFESGRTPPLTALYSILSSLMKNFSRVYFVLDAVDESMPRDSLLSIIERLSTDAAFSSLNLLITSREYADIEVVLQPLSSRISMSNDYIEEDIRRLTRSRMLADRRYQKWPDAMKRDMVDLVPRKAKGMFRWAVCQLHELARVRPIAEVINAALANLPKTLDETYERILRGIPDDDKLSVAHAFRWMHYHSEMSIASRDTYNNIPVNILVHAVQESTSEVPDARYLPDFDSLRELCGCLIRVQETIKKEKAYCVITFAHFTVKEFLLSTRTDRMELGLFRLNETRAMVEIAWIVVRTALTTTPNQVEKYLLEITDRSPKYSRPNLNPYSRANSDHSMDLLYDDFVFYCGVMSVVQIYRCPCLIASDDQLVEFYHQFITPRSPLHKHFEHIFEAINRDYLWLMSFSANSMPLDLFWNIKWYAPFHPHVAIFFNLLCISARAECEHSLFPINISLKHSDPAALRTLDDVPLIRTLTRKIQVLDLITAACHLSCAIDFEYDLRDGNTDKSMPQESHIRGTVPEIVARLPHVSSTFPQMLSSIEGLSHCQLDLNTLLLSLVSSKSHNKDCLEFSSNICSLKRLLELGADPNGPADAYVSPLQIATYNLDSVAMYELINAGARVDITGAAGVANCSHNFLKPWKRLSGGSPLAIFLEFGQSTRKANLIWDRFYSESRRILTEVRANDIRLAGWPDNSLPLGISRSTMDEQ